MWACTCTSMRARSPFNTTPTHLPTYMHICSIYQVCLKPGHGRLSPTELIFAVKGLVHGKTSTKLRLLWALSGFSEQLPISRSNMVVLLQDIPTKKLRTDTRYKEHLRRVADQIFERAEENLVRQCITLPTFIRIAPSVQSLKPILAINKQIR